MRFVRLVAASLASWLIACGDDAARPADEGGGGGGGGGQGTGVGGGAAGGGAGGAPSACGDGVTESDVDGAEWDTRFTIAGVASQYGIAPVIHDFAVDGDGSVIAAGRFDTLSGATVPPLLRFVSGAWEPARSTWEITPPGDGFSAVAVDAGAMALATNDSFGEMTGEIWVDEGGGLVSVGAFEGRVRRLAFFDGRLWVAGLFTLAAGGTPINDLAVWDGAAWSPPPGGPADGPAFELIVDGATLMVGGAFTSVGGLAAANVAAFDGTDWSALDFDGALAIYALSVDGADIYAGGAFGDFAEAGGVAKWDGSGWSVVGGGLAQYQTRGVVTDLVAHDGVLDATGCFNSAGGLDGEPGAVAARAFARFDGASWESLDDGAKGAISPWFAPLVCGDEGLTAVWDVPHQALAAGARRLFAGGSFAGAGGVASQSLVAHDGSAWVAQGTGALGIAGSLDRIAAGGAGCEVYGVGTFSHVGGVAATGRVVHFDGSGWTNLIDSLPSDAWCPALDVSAGGAVAVGCMVFLPSGDAEGVVLRREGEEMVKMNVSGVGPVMAVAWSPEGSLWVGGAGQTGYLARIDGTDVTVVEAGFDGPVQHIDVASNGDVIVAGPFQSVGPVVARRIARWDGAAWTALGDGLPGAPTALARDGAIVYASTYDEGEGAYLLGRFDGAEWTELATSGSGVTKRDVFNFNSLTVVGGALLAGGAVELDDGSGRGVLVYRDGVFRAMGGGVSAISIGALALTDDALWVGGSIMAAGGGSEPTSSVGVARSVFP